MTIYLDLLTRSTPSLRNHLPTVPSPPPPTQPSEYPGKKVIETSSARLTSGVSQSQTDTICDCLNLVRIGVSFTPPQHCLHFNHHWWTILLNIVEKLEFFLHFYSCLHVTPLCCRTAWHGRSGRQQLRRQFFILPWNRIDTTTAQLFIIVASFHQKISPPTRTLTQAWRKIRKQELFITGASSWISFTEVF